MWGFESPPGHIIIIHNFFKLKLKKNLYFVEIFIKINKMKEAKSTFIFSIRTYTQRKEI